MEDSRKTLKRVDRGPGPRGLTEPIAPISSDEDIKAYIRERVGENPSEAAWPTVEALRTKFQAGNRRVMRLREQVGVELGVTTVPKRNAGRGAGAQGGVDTIEDFRSRMQDLVAATAELQGSSSSEAQVLEPAIKEVLLEVRQLKRTLQEKGVVKGPGRPSARQDEDLMTLIDLVYKLHDHAEIDRRVMREVKRDVESVEQAQADIAKAMQTVKAQVTTYNTDMDAACERLSSCAESAVDELKNAAEARGNDFVSRVSFEVANFWNQWQSALGDLEELVGARVIDATTGQADRFAELRADLSSLKDEVRVGRGEAATSHSDLLRELNTSFLVSQRKTHNYFRVLTETIEEQAEMPVTLDDYSINVLGGIAVFAPEYWNTRGVSRAKSRRA